MFPDPCCRGGFAAIALREGPDSSSDWCSILQGWSIKGALTPAHDRKSVKIGSAQDVAIWSLGEARC